MMKKVIFLINSAILFLLMQSGSVGIYAQSVDHRNRQVDSLENVLATNPPTGDGVIVVYRDLMFGYSQINIEKSMYYARKCIAAAIPYDGWMVVSTCNRTLAESHYRFSQYDSAMVYYEKSMEAAERMRDFEKYTELMIDNGFSSLYGSMGNFYNIQGKYYEAIEYYQKALKLFEKNDSKHNQVIAYSNIGEMYMAMNNYAQAENNFIKMDSLAHLLDIPYYIALAKEALSSIFLYHKDYEQALKNAEIAYDYYFAHPEEEGEKKVVILNILSEIYLDGYGDAPRAEAYAREALLLLDDLGLPREQSVSLRLLSSIHLGRGDWHLCAYTAHSALLADASEPSNTLALYSILVKAYAHLGDAAQSASYFDRYAALQSSWSTHHYQSSLSEMEVKYETAKKETEIERQQHVIARAHVHRRTLLAGVFILLSSLIVLWRWSVHKRRFAAQQIKQLEQEKQLIATQAVLEGELQERSRLARDLHDGLGSILTGAKLNLEQMLKGAVLDEESLARYHAAFSLIDTSQVEMRRVAHHLMPEALTELGLKHATADFCKSVPRTSFQYYGADTPRLDPQLEAMLYRIMHELVSNALKHSGAERIIVQLVRDEDRIALNVQDNGCGFDIATASTHGMGLSNIRNRVAAFNGSMMVDARVGVGTEVSVEVKVEK